VPSELTAPDDTSCCETEGCAATRARKRAVEVRRGLRLEVLTVGWNVVEGVVALGAALAAGSVALFGFGVDSFVESASGAILIWRLRSELTGAHGHDAIERLEHRARRLVALSLFALAAWVAFDAVRSLHLGERPDPSLVGIAVTAVSVVVMQWLARAKRATAKSIGSRALEADAFQTTACVYLSLAALAGIGLNLLLGWWWADPVAALVIAVLLVREGRSAWAGEECC
jgi:divalent metal cation (Fe/Co/Zn/Cd) transporter